MDKRYRRINMDNIRKNVINNGFYCLSLNRVYDDFYGCKYIIVTNQENFIENHPQFLDEIIMTIEEFASYAVIFNTFLGNEDCERKRRAQHIIFDEESEIISRKRYNSNPTEDAAIEDYESKKINKALEQLTETQRRRFKLFFFYDWTERQIAEHEQINRYAVRKSLEQSIKKLKKIF